MALENINEIEQSLGLEAGKLTELITSEENHKVDLSNRVFFAKDDYDKRITNMKGEIGTAAIEMAVKEARRERGIETKDKSIGSLLEAWGEKISQDSKIEPNQKYDTLKSDFDKLQGVNRTLEEKYTSLESNIKKERDNSLINASILNEIPDNTTIPKEDVLTIIRAKNSVRIGDNGGIEILDSNGDVIKNQTTLDPIGIKEFISLSINPYLKEVDGGKGGNDDKGQHSEGSFEAFVKQMEQKGISEGSEPFNEEMMKRIENGTLKL